MWCASSFAVTNPWKTLETHRNYTCKWMLCEEKAAGRLTGLGFLVGVEGFRTTRALSQGARPLLLLLVLLPFLVRSCPLTVRVWLLLRLILPPSAHLSLRTPLSPSVSPWWLSPLPSLSLSLAGRSSQQSPYSLLRIHNLNPVPVHPGNESINLCAAAERKGSIKSKRQSRSETLQSKRGMESDSRKNAEVRLLLFSLASPVLLYISCSAPLFLLPHIHTIDFKPFASCPLFPPRFNPFSVWSPGAAAEHVI